MELRRKLRRFDLKMTLRRFYIEKSNGKLRPIGAPSLISRIISKALNDMTYYIFQDGMQEFQHGYRLGKGTGTAL